MMKRRCSGQETTKDVFKTAENMLLATSIIVVLGNDLLSPKRHMKAMFRRGKVSRQERSSNLTLKVQNLCAVGHQQF